MERSTKEKEVASNWKESDVKKEKRVREVCARRSKNQEGG